MRVTQLSRRFNINECSLSSLPQYWNNFIIFTEKKLRGGGGIQEKLWDKKYNLTLRPWCQVILSWIMVNLSSLWGCLILQLGHCTVSFKVAVFFSKLYFPNILCPNGYSQILSLTWLITLKYFSYSRFYFCLV